jgi:hypothetical protein
MQTYRGGPVGLDTWAYVAAMFVGPLLNAVGDTRTFVLGRRLGCDSRGAVSSLVMRKVRGESCCNQFNKNLLWRGGDPAGDTLVLGARRS